jgi:hypothetical protein
MFGIFLSFSKNRGGGQMSGSAPPLSHNPWTNFKPSIIYFYVEISVSIIRFKFIKDIRIIYNKRLLLNNKPHI